MSDLNQIVVNPDAVALTGFLLMLVVSYLLSKTSFCVLPTPKPIPLRQAPRFYQWYESADGGTTLDAQDMQRDYHRHSRIYHH